MSFDHIKAFSGLKRQHERERVLLQSAGISDEIIQEFFDADVRQLNRDRAFYNHLDKYVGPDDETFIDTAELETRLGWLEQIENLKLLEAMQSLPLSDLEIIRLHINEQLPLTFVAALLDKPYEQVKKRYYRIIKNLIKNF